MVVRRPWLGLDVELAGIPGGLAVRPGDRPRVLADLRIRAAPIGQPRISPRRDGDRGPRRSATRLAGLVLRRPHLPLDSPGLARRSFRRGLSRQRPHAPVRPYLPRRTSADPAWRSGRPACVSRGRRSSTLPDDASADRADLLQPGHHLHAPASGRGLADGFAGRLVRDRHRLAGWGPHLLVADHLGQAGASGVRSSDEDRLPDPGHDR